MLTTQLPDVLDLFKTLADPSRLRLVSWLAEREQTTTELAERLS